MINIWKDINIVSLLLLPLSLIYWLICLLRNILFIPKKVKCPVICIGNINLGGSGKTPISMAIAKYFINKGKKVAFLSRGYKGSLSSQNPVRVIDSFAAKEVGDEPLLLNKIAPTYICVDRYKAANMAVNEGADLLIMDDGLQNRSLYQDYKILVLGKLGNHIVLPAGPLRETVAQGIKKSNLVISTEADNADLASLNLKPYVKNSKAIKGNDVVVLTAIACPNKFFQTLGGLNVEIIEEFVFPDHHNFTEKELRPIYHLAMKKKCKVITTSKDFVKIPDIYHHLTQVVEIDYKIPSSVLEQIGNVIFS